MTKDIDAAMNSMPPGWKSRWCNSHMCACMGCANKSGGLTAKGYTYQDWRDWISRNQEEYMNGLSPTVKPFIMTYGQEKKMTEKEHLECEIKKVQLQIEEKARQIGKLKDYINQLEHQLGKMNDTPRNTNEAVENKQKELLVSDLESKNWYVNMKEFTYPMLEVIDENTVKIEGVEYKKVSKEKTPTIYEFLTQCAYGEWNPDLVDTETQIQIETNAENFVNYLYEYCDVIEEDDDKMIVSISKTQMVIPND